MNSKQLLKVKVCIRHFEPRLIGGNAQPKLVKNAVPTIRENCQGLVSRTDVASGSSSFPLKNSAVVDDFFKDHTYAVCLDRPIYPNCLNLEAEPNDITPMEHDNVLNSGPPISGTVVEGLGNFFLQEDIDKTKPNCNSKSEDDDNTIIERDETHTAVELGTSVGLHGKTCCILTVNETAENSSVEGKGFNTSNSSEIFPDNSQSMCVDSNSDSTLKSRPTPVRKRPYSEISKDCKFRCSKKVKTLLTRFNLEKRNLTPGIHKMIKSLKTAEGKLKKIMDLRSKDKSNLRSARRLFKDSNFLVTQMTRKVSHTFQALLKSEIRNHGRKKQGKRWTLDDKTLALSLFKRSPKCYRFLRKLIELPSPRTLQRTLAYMVLEAGPNEAINELLKESVGKMKEKEKYCVLMIDEMAIRQGVYLNKHNGNIEGMEDFGHLGRTNREATHALVFMLKGLNQRWKQPYCYYLTRDLKAEKLVPLILHVIKSVQDVGLIPIATVCDQASTNTAAFEQLASRVKDRPGPYFQVNGQSIVYFYDAPHLLKNMRNNLMDKDLKMPGENGEIYTAKWKHLQDLYQLDKDKGQIYRVLPKLTDLHLNPEGKQKMKVKYASQLFSQRVCAILNWSRGNMLPEEVIGTQKFVELMDQLFDSFNGGGSNSSAEKPLRHRLTATSKHNEFWNAIFSILHRMVFIVTNSKQSSKPPCLLGWIHNIRAIRHLFTKITSETEWSHITMRHLNQDPLENFFGIIRQHSVNNTNPTAQQFVSAFKASIINNMTSSFAVRGSNCEADNGELLCDLKRLLQNNLERTESLQTGQHSAETDADADRQVGLDPQLDLADKEVNLLERAAITYVAGYFVRKIVAQGSCESCVPFLHSEEQSNDYSVIGAREYKKGVLVRPSKNVVSIVEKASSLVRKKFPLVRNKNALVGLLSNQICNMELISKSKVGCSKHDKLVKNQLVLMSIRLQIYKLCKDSNQPEAKKQQKIAAQKRNYIWKSSRKVR